ncbi:MAG: glycosyltransferase family 9 protein [Bacteriovoracaceae bacterium]|nr:glycosyltransferase family 9 protein [Bacteriovoracaceae bacterium]
MKIAVRLPAKAKDVMNSFPFLHAIHDQLKPDYLHLIAEKEAFELLTLLPFKAYFHDFDTANYKNFLDVHRFCVNKLDLSHAEVFFSLSDLPRDKFMSFCFRSVKRVGFDSDWSKVFLNDKHMYGVGLHQAERYFSLLENFHKMDLGSFGKVRAKLQKPLIKDFEENPYMVVNLPFDSIIGDIPKDWIEFIDFFEKQRVFITCSDLLGEKAHIVLKHFMDKLKMPFNIMPFVYRDLSEFSQLVSTAKGFIGINGVHTSAAAYSGCKTLIVYESGNPKEDAPLFFQGAVNIHDISDVSLHKKPEDFKRSEGSSRFDLGKLYDKAVSYFQLK